MDHAIDMHNRCIRDLLFEYGGHEIRNEGDSFVLSFHDALDGIFFCLRAQEKLQSLNWPHRLTSQVRERAKAAPQASLAPEPRIDAYDVGSSATSLSRARSRRRRW